MDYNEYIDNIVDLVTLEAKLELSEIEIEYKNKRIIDIDEYQLKQEHQLEYV